MVAQFHTRLRDSLDALGERISWHTPGSWRPFADGEVPPGWVMVRSADGTIRQVYEGGWLQISIASPADVVMRWYPQLRRCRRCRTWFLPTHGRQWCHDTVCGSKARYERFKLKRDLVKLRRDSLRAKGWLAQP